MDIIICKTWICGNNFQLLHMDAFDKRQLKIQVSSIKHTYKYIILRSTTEYTLIRGNTVTLFAKFRLCFIFCFCFCFSISGCFKTIPNCASCLDHRTCLRCQKGFAFLESYWGALCVVKCPEGFTEVATSGNGTMCKSRKGTSYNV